MSKNKQQNKIPAKQPNAAQRIASVEKSLQALSENTSSALNQMNQTTLEKINILADEIDKLSGSLKSLNKRLNATLETTQTADTVNKMMLDDAVKELKSKVDQLIELGAIEELGDAPITDRTFVVGREIDEAGNEVNPRVQFATMSLPENLQKELLGKRLGDKVSFEEGKPSFEITELYLIKEVEKKMEFEDSQNQAPESPDTEEVQEQQ